MVQVHASPWSTARMDRWLRGRAAETGWTGSFAPPNLWAHLLPCNHLTQVPPPVEHSWPRGSFLVRASPPPSSYHASHASRVMQFPRPCVVPPFFPPPSPTPLPP
eukprot:314880-Chlamydomonas_euryale.AAC.1